jgi:hypothetical protein
MSPVPEEPDFVREVRERCAREGGVLWLEKDELGVFEPEAARNIHACHYADLTLEDKLSDVVRGKRSEPVSWKDLRALWMAQLRRLSGGDGLRVLEARMVALLEARRGRLLDLVWLAHEVITGSLLSVVVASMPDADRALVQRDQERKLRRLLDGGAARATLCQELRFVLGQVRSGNAVRRELKGRAAGRRPRTADLLDPVVDLLPALGTDRAVDAVTALVTAIAGPPGAVAPETHRFVKEVLRMWGPPMFMTRETKDDLQVGGEVPPGRGRGTIRALPAPGRAHP